jgi:2-polyprenyl-3-methyl-5-hydroxy-6-metoxy-1,4-benzoquinol methylase
MLGVVNGGALTLMTSVAHRTGLFDTMACLPPSTSEQIAEAAGLDERYVREWLGAMVTGGVVEYDPEDGAYALPEEHAAFLTRAATPDNVAVVAQVVPLLATVEDLIVGCFRSGGGVPYSAYPRFQEVMAEISAQTVVSKLVDTILPLVPGGVRDLEGGIAVLDVGCGRGGAVNAMAAAFPVSRFVGYDVSEEGIAAAREEAARRNLRNVRFEVKDAAAMDEASRYKLITAFDVIHDQARPAAVLAAIARALRRGGTFLMQDIRGSSHVHRNVGHPASPLLYTVSCMHCMTVSLAAGGVGLGAMWGEEKALEMLAAAGFHDVEVTRFPHDIMNNFYVVRK